MLKWLQTLPRAKRLALYIGCSLLGIMSFCLIIASIVNDGINQFAKVFYITSQKPVPDDRYKEFIAWANQHSVADEVKNAVKDLFGDTLYVDVETQNALGFGFFIATMVLIVFICVIIVSSITYVSIPLLKYQTHTAYRENMITEEQFSKFLDLYDEVLNSKPSKTKVDKKQEQLELLNNQLQKLEQQNELINEAK